jgi:hypothetical protein
MTTGLFWRLYLRWQAAQEPVDEGLNRLCAGELDDAAADLASNFSITPCARNPAGAG